MESEIYIVTSNLKKFSIAQGLSENVKTIPPPFNEPEIKKILTPSLGVAYPIEISRQKLKQVLNSPEANEMPPETIFVVSDSVMLIHSEDNVLALNRDLTEEERNIALREIKGNNNITFVGAVSFGSRNSSIFTVASWLSTQGNFDTFPIPIESLNSPQNIFEIGFIKFDVRSGKYLFLETAQTPDFTHARPYISGLTPETLALIEEFNKINQEISPSLQDIISRHPFNTLSFYTRNPDYSKTNEKYWLNWTETYGGNCSLLSLKTALLLNDFGLDPEIILFPSSKPDHPRGHAAVIINRNSTQFLVEPGLSIPFPIPILKIPPLLPFVIKGGTRSAFIESSDPHKITLHLLDKGTKFTSNGIYDIQSFLKSLPIILSELHRKRRFIKIDQHNPDGTLRHSVRINTENNPPSITAIVNGQPSDPSKLPLPLKKELNIYLSKSTL